MNASPAAYDLIKRFESLKLRKYLDPVGKWTIGWGHLIREDEDFPGPISQEIADELLATDVGYAEDDVNRLVSVPLNQKQFDALVSLVFNIGGSALAKSRNTLPMINSGEYAKIPNAIKSWNKGRKKDPISGRMVLVELPGLTRRRKEEAELFKAGNTEMFGEG